MRERSPSSAVLLRKNAVLKELQNSISHNNVKRRSKAIEDMSWGTYWTLETEELEELGKERVVQIYTKTGAPEGL